MMDKAITCPECKGHGTVDKQEIREDLRPDKSIATMTQELCPCRNGSGSAKVPMTNADRIRTMNDEELAKFLLETEQGNFTIECCDDRFCDPGHCCNDCTDAAIKWLQAPTEEV